MITTAVMAMDIIGISDPPSNLKQISGPRLTCDHTDSSQCQRPCLQASRRPGGGDAYALGPAVELLYIEDQCGVQFRCENVRHTD